MPLQIIRNDITKVKCDAIVNAANSSLLGGGGVDGAIHRAAGSGLLVECMKLHGCKTGQAKITGGYKLPCRYVIHTVGPVWHGGNNGEENLLISCYENSLQLAVENKCESVAFPLISSGIYGYPKEQALRVAVNTINSFLEKHDILVYIVIFDKKSFVTGEKLFSDIASYIDDNYAQQAEKSDSRRNMPLFMNSVSYQSEKYTSSEDLFDMTSLEERLNCIDESFSEMLMRKIDEKGIKDSECYKKANVDRKLL